MAAVAPDLRNPLLPFLPGTTRAWLLPLFRLNSRIRWPSGQGVTVTERRVGEPAVRVLITTPTEVTRRDPGCSGFTAGALSWVPRSWKHSEQPAWQGISRLSRSHRNIGWRPNIRFRPRWTIAWPRCGGCGRTPTSWASIRTASPSWEPVPAAACPPPWHNAATTRGSHCGRRCWCTRCSTTAPRCARTAPAAAGSCGHPHPTCSAGPATWVARHACRTRRSTRHRRGAKI